LLFTCRTMNTFLNREMKGWCIFVFTRSHHGCRRRLLHPSSVFIEMESDDDGQLPLCHTLSPAEDQDGRQREDAIEGPTGRNLRLQPRREDPACADRAQMRVKHNMLSAHLLRCVRICPS